MTLRISDFQSDSDLDSIRNSCDVLLCGSEDKVSRSANSLEIEQVRGEILAALVVNLAFTAFMPLVWISSDAHLLRFGMFTLVSA